MKQLIEAARAVLETCEASEATRIAGGLALHRLREAVNAADPDEPAPKQLPAVAPIPPAWERPPLGPEKELTNMAALALAERAHTGQLRRGGKDPYITHPRAVAGRVHPDLRAIALLHDVLEDTYVTEAELRETFPAWVVDRVVLLTRAKGEIYEDYIARVATDRAAIEVKLADLEHNLSDLPAGEQRDRYLRAQKRLWSVIGGAA